MSATIQYYDANNRLIETQKVGEAFNPRDVAIETQEYFTYQRAEIYGPNDQYETVYFDEVEK